MFSCSGNLSLCKKAASREIFSAAMASILFCSSFSIFAAMFISSLMRLCAVQGISRGDAGGELVNNDAHAHLSVSRFYRTIRPGDGKPFVDGCAAGINADSGVEVVTILHGRGCSDVALDYCRAFNVTVHDIPAVRAAIHVGPLGQRVASFWRERFQPVGAELGATSVRIFRVGWAEDVHEYAAVRHAAGIVFCVR